MGQRLRGPGGVAGTGDGARGAFEVDTWTVAETGGRTVTYLVETAPPFRLIRWSASDGEEASLLGSERLAYWELNKPGGEKWLKGLGLKAR